jgi:hypothetical protein
MTIPVKAIGHVLDAGKQQDFSAQQIWEIKMASLLMQSRPRALCDMSHRFRALAVHKSNFILQFTVTK